jgi:hypothetical protein
MSRRTLTRLAFAVVAALLLATGPCREFLGRVLIVGPGSADFAYPLTAGLSLERSSAGRHIIGWLDQDPADYEDARREYGGPEGYVLVDADVTALGWNERFIVCYQTDSPLAKERASGWWIIDTREHRRTGPMTEAQLRSCREKLGIGDMDIRAPEKW